VPTDPDVILLETIRTHRSRLRSAFIFGELTERRIVDDNSKRFVASVVVAAVVCAGCVGVSFVGHLLSASPAGQVAGVVSTPVPSP
jgi:cation transporter-like permease